MKSNYRQNYKDKQTCTIINIYKKKYLYFTEKILKYCTRKCKRGTKSLPRGPITFTEGKNSQMIQKAVVWDCHSKSGLLCTDNKKGTGRTISQSVEWVRTSWHGLIHTELERVVGSVGSGATWMWSIQRKLLHLPDSLTATKSSIVYNQSGSRRDQWWDVVEIWDWAVIEIDGSCSTIDLGAVSSVDQKLTSVVVFSGVVDGDSTTSTTSTISGCSCTKII